MLRIIFLTFFTCSFFNIFYAQSTTEKTTLNVFLDCSFCDLTYFRTNVSYLNYVRDRETADVHVLATRMRGGSNSFNYTFDFIGLGDFTDENFQLTLSELPNITRLARTQNIAKKVEMGLVPFWVKTDLVDNLNVQIDNPTSTENQVEQQMEDAWNNWVFSVEAGGSASVESSKKRFVGYGRVRANRVTETWRVRNQIFARYQRQRFETAEGEDPIISATERNFLSSSTVRSISDHISAGFFAFLARSTYNNLDLETRLAPAFEYSLFPYSEVNRREVTLAYRFNHTYRDYNELTIYEKLEEALWSQSLVFSTRLQQPWGSFWTQIQGSHYLHNLEENRLEIDTRLSLRVTKGLSVSLNGEVELINDQRSLPAGDISFEDLILSQRQIATNFRVSGSVGVNYTFGSIYNNVVNTRL
ncbi:MAG: hypothetical protein AAGJ18_25800 [Bacteroidota bacterium]